MFQCLEYLIEWIALSNVFCGQICEECGEEHTESGVAMGFRLSFFQDCEILDGGQYS